MARPLGSKNQRRIDVDERLAALNCKPLEGMARIAKIAEENGEYALAGNMYKELIKYVLPQLKAVEHSGNIDGNQSISVVRYEIIESDSAKKDTASIPSSV